MIKRALIVLAACILALTGCSSGGGDASQGAQAPATTGGSAAPTDVRIGYISFGESFPYVHSITEGIKAAAKTAGAEVVVCDSQNDAEKALECAKRFKLQDIDGIINYQGDVKAAASICAQGPDVPVIAITIPQEPCQVAWTGADNVAAGTLAGKKVGGLVKQKYNCEYDAYVSVEVTKTGKTGIDRMGGYRAGFESVCGKIHDAKVFDSKSSAEIARASMTDTLTALPDAHRIIVVGMDDAVIVGAISAASSANRLKDVLVSGQGLDSSGVCGMRKYPDQWIGDTAFFPEHYGEVLVPAIIKAVKGETLPEKLPAKIDFVTPETVDDFYADVTC